MEYPIHCLEANSDQVMFKIIAAYLSTHLVIVAVFASALWFYAGYQDVGKGKRTNGIAWEVIGVVLMIMFCAHAAFSYKWFSAAIACIAITFEMKIMLKQLR